MDDNLPFSCVLLSICLHLWWNLGWSILVHWLELKQMLLALCSSVLPSPHKCHVNDVITFYALSLGIEECSDKARSLIFPLVGVSWESLPQHGFSTWNVAVSDFSCWLWYRRSWRASSSSQWEVRRGTRDKMLKREERVDPIPLVSERKHLKWQNPEACLRGWMYFHTEGVTGSCVELVEPRRAIWVVAWIYQVNVDATP